MPGAGQYLDNRIRTTRFTRPRSGIARTENGVKVNRTSIISKIKATAAALGKTEQQRNALTWQMAEQLVLLRGTFTAGQGKAFLATAATASGKGEASVRNMVRAVEVRDSLTSKQRQGISGWSYDAVLSLASPDSRQRTTIISKAAKQGTDAKSVRKIKADVVGRQQRQRQTSAEATTKLAEKIKADVVKLLAHGHDPLALAAGARLARQYPGDVAAAITFVAVNAKSAEKVVK